MKKLLAIFAMTSLFMAGPCTFDSLSLAIDPGFGDRSAFVGVEFDFGDVDFVIPITALNR